MNILIAGCTVLPMTASEADAHKYFTGNIGIADGRIAFAGADPQQAAAFRARCGTSLREIDGRGKVAMPDVYKRQLYSGDSVTFHNPGQRRLQTKAPAAEALCCQCSE